MPVYSSIKGKKYNVSDIEIGSGGEGKICDILNAANYVAKIYKPEEITREKEEKLKLLLSSFPNDPYGIFVPPLDILYDNGKFVGYVMSKKSGCRTFTNFYSENQRGGLPWSLFIEVAKTFALAVSLIHKSENIVIGDFNPENFLIDSNNKKIYFIDTDAYHIKANNGYVFRCLKSFPDNTAPELNEISFKDPSIKKTFTQETDLFSLATIIFSLLMNGAHPYNAPVTVGPSKSRSDFQLNLNIIKGYCAWYP
ncbi:MAG: hypothetical protein LBM93_03630, partial [Oscillospiraceae bacterium]|nr:hypothetical protein [Oscillospiraceae bacterium]